MTISPKKILVVGQGIAGTWISYYLYTSGHCIEVYENNSPGASSIKSSGIINPITGRRFVKTWNIDKLLPFARNAYKELASFLNTNLVSDISIIKIIHSIKDDNDFQSYMHSGDYEPYFAPQEKTVLCNAFSKHDLGAYLIHNAIRVDIVELLQGFSSWLQQYKLYNSSTFSYELLEPESSTYNGIKYDYIIFCEGYQINQNPYFKHIPIIPNKGQYLKVRTKQTHGITHTIASHGIIFPLDAYTFYVGATYEWTEFEMEPDEKGKNFLCDIFESAISLPYEIIEHGCGIRPSYFKRKPIICRHFAHPNFFAFNGLGSKGISTAPYYAKQLCEYMLHHKLPDADVLFNLD